MTLRHWRRAMLTAVLACVLASPAVAQQPTPTEGIPDPPEPVQEEWLSWHLPGWTFLPGVTIAAIHDSNVGWAGPLPGSGRTESDNLFLVQPFGRAEYRSPRTAFTAGYRGYVRRYGELSQLNGYNQRVSASLHRRVTRMVTVFASNSFHDVPTTDEVILNGTPFARAGVRTNTFNGGVTARVSRVTDFSTRYENTWVTFDHTADALLSDGVLHGVQTTLSRRLSNRLSAGGHYDLRLANVNNRTRELTFQDIGGTVTYALGSRTRVSGAAGVSHLHDRTSDTTRTGPFVRLSIVHGIERVIVGANFQRSLVPAFGFGGSTSTQQLGGYVRMPLASNRMYVQGALTWRRTDPFLEDTLEADTIWARTTVGYALARRARLEVFHAYTRQDSIVTGGEVDRHRIGLQAVITQPMRIR
jgi:hypothetical protein